MCWGTPPLPQQHCFTGSQEEFHVVMAIGDFQQRLVNLALWIENPESACVQHYDHGSVLFPEAQPQECRMRIN